MAEFQLYMIIILFGLPGAGKTYVGKLMHKFFNYTFYDGDHDVTDAIKTAIETKTPFTDDMRDEFFLKLFHSMDRLLEHHENLVIAQTFIKERYRLQALERFPKAQFILVKTRSSIREERLEGRVEMHLERNYARQMVRNFDIPHIKHAEVNNNREGDEELVEQLKKIPE